ncbi:hypothetical protein HanRHA438_Chr15g0682941 [Helianthus annuus]|nr:hypothetical protein HanRHA438_Chr15g0682941 [Helianthus annuus]
MLSGPRVLADPANGVAPRVLRRLCLCIWWVYYEGIHDGSCNLMKKNWVNLIRFESSI